MRKILCGGVLLLGSICLGEENIFNKIEPSIVMVYAEQEKPFSIHPQSSYCSGIIIDQNGYILAANNILEPELGVTEVKVKVILGNQRLVYRGRGNETMLVGEKKEFSAEIITREKWMNLAVLKIELPKGLKLCPVILGNSDEVNVGDEVIVAGYPMSIKTIQFGKILSRPIPKENNLNTVVRKEDFFVIDVPPLKPQAGGALILQDNNEIVPNCFAAPGISGGGAFNKKRELIGILFFHSFSKRTSSTTFQVEWICTALPSNIVKNFLSQIQKEKSN